MNGRRAREDRRALAARQQRAESEPTVSTPIPGTQLKVRRWRPVEVKVIAGSAGAGAGQIITEFLLWGLDDYAFTAGPVPAAVVAFVGLIVTSGLAFAAGWLAPHTLRPDLTTTEDGQDGWVTLGEPR